MNRIDHCLAPIRFDAAFTFGASPCDRNVAGTTTTMNVLFVERILTELKLLNILHLTCRSFMKLQISKTERATPVEFGTFPWRNIQNQFPWNMSDGLRIIHGRSPEPPEALLLVKSWLRRSLRTNLVADDLPFLLRVVVLQNFRFVRGKVHQVLQEERKHGNEKKIMVIPLRRPKHSHLETVESSRTNC